MSRKQKVKEFAELSERQRRRRVAYESVSFKDDKYLEDATRQIMEIESVVIGNYEVEGEFLIPITSTSKYIPPINKEQLLNQEEEVHNYEQQDEHVIEQQEGDILTNLSVKIEKKRLHLLLSCYCTNLTK
ncbi:hypothetical protein FQA39_LY17444 [Lamprigera yunnana]|nr:hypothetical protein FQA39_LY17444 [Lamprigera yunnana]